MLSFTRSTVRHPGIFRRMARRNFGNSAGSYLCHSRIQPFHGGAKAENFSQKSRFFRALPYFVPYTLQNFAVIASIQSLKIAPVTTHFRRIFGQETARRNWDFRHDNPLLRAFLLPYIILINE